ncbi:hypothetical protein BDV96DRAFT_685560 [Lophiotrema nucula]|uniref:Azaphilone pigments biosynthesis cluster protein L N-terminal domain-containing protein n=1 Tax=Lophiotrema nucula TaxID=690887 RepID=A0A6A5ZG76_9PLEO|nr:hypothetical protein BDV96DRAFT_685560 [Lophiotrema nucula]
MGDPFSVAGTAVGITSLGIQICQGLVQYYSQFRSYHDDIESAIQRLEGLEGILKALESVKSKVEMDNHEPSEQLQLAMRACEACLKKLELQLKKCGETKIPGTLKDRANMARKRLLWPFKRDTLKDLQGTLDRLQHNLQLSLKILGIDLAHHHFNTLISQGKEIALRNDHLEHQHSDQTRALHRIEVGLDTALQSQSEQTSILTTQIAYHTADISVQLESIQQSLSLLTTETGHMRPLNETPPSVLSDAFDNYRNINATYKRSLRNYNRSNNQLGKRHATVAMSCQCRMYKVEAEQKWAWGRFSTISRWESDHVPECPRFQHTDYLSSIQARFIHCSRYLGFCASIGLSYTKLRGQTTISPTISYRAVVPIDSPGFRPFQDAYTSIGVDNRCDLMFQKIDLEHWTQDNIEDLLQTTLANVLRSFDEGGSKPSDTLATGKTIFHSACHVIATFLSLHLVDGDTACMFLGSLIAAGVPTNETGLDNRTPFECFWVYATVESEASRTVCLFLAKGLDSWSSHWWGFILHWRIAYTHVTYLLNNDESALAYEESSPEMNVAFVQRSLPALQHHLHSGRWDTRKPPPWTLAFWTEGLEAYPLDQVNWSDHGTNEHEILPTCIWLSNARATGYLVGGGAHVNPRDFSIAVFAFEGCGFEERRDVFTILARALKRHELAQLSANEGWDDSYGIEENYGDLYYLNTYKFDTVVAESLYDAGFCEIDRMFDGRRGPATPAWAHATWTDSVNSIAELSQLLSWFEEKGANLYWIHPDFLATPIHVFVRRWTDVTMRPLSRHGKIDSGVEDSFTAKAILSDTRDQCSCHCSNGGCLPTTCVMQEIMDMSQESVWRPWRWEIILQSIQELLQRASALLSRICRAVDARDETDTHLHHAIIRALTFQQLHLTHTCCRYVAREVKRWGDHEGWHEPLKRPDSGEIQELHDIESNQIELLEHLISQFEPEWNEYSGTFYDFIKTVWKPYVEEELDRYYGNNEDEARRFRQLGVILNDEEWDIYEISTEDEEYWSEDRVDAVVFGPERPPVHS